MDTGHRDSKEGIKAIGEAYARGFHQEKEIKWVCQLAASLLLGMIASVGLADWAIGEKDRALTAEGKEKAATG